MDNNEIRYAIEEIVSEGIRLGSATGLSLGTDWHTEAIRYLEAGGYHRPSIANDLYSKRPTEDETQSEEKAPAKKTRAAKS